MLTPYCHNVLKTELAKADYAGPTAEQAWAWLMVPVVDTSEVDTGALLTPILAARVLGAVKANALAARVRALLPEIATSLMESGVNLSDPATGAFLGTLVGDSLTAEDIAALLALGKRTVVVTQKPRFDTRFYPALWPHVASDGTTGESNDQAIHGFPNTITRDEFDAAWQEVRGG